MLIFKECPYYRDFRNLAMGRGLGHCDLGGEAICERDINFCDRPDDLKKGLSEKKKRENENKARDPKKEHLHCRVLVVDDQEEVRRLVVALLSREGHQCITAVNGVDALNKMIQAKCDAVITDIVMPEKDGITLTKELLALYPKFPILVMSGHSKEYSIDSALMAGAQDFIGKPFSIAKFMLRFNKMMRDQAMLSRWRPSRMKWCFI